MNTSMDKQTLLETFLPPTRHNTHPRVREWLGERLEQTLRAELTAAVERVYSDDLAAQFITHCRVAGAGAEDYKNRVLTVGETRVIAGIRFRGLDMNRPFVEVAAQTAAITHRGPLEHLHDTLMTEFALFKPRRIQLYLASPLTLGPSALTVAGDKRYLAAPLAVMNERAEPVGYDRARLARATTLDFYPAYEAAYRELFAARPWLQEEARLETREDMAGYLEEGYVFEVFVDDGWAGVVGVYPDEARGLTGHCVADIMLARAARGQGLGVVVQRRLAEALGEVSDATTLVYGTIGANNAPALKTAERAGRMDVGGEWWVSRDV